MKNVTTDLLALQSAETTPGGRSSLSEASIQALRKKVPAPILAQFDRLRLRGKKGLAVVRNGVCSECHISIPLGTLRRAATGDEIQVCGNCGRCLHLPEEAAAAINTPPPHPSERKPVKRKKAAPVHAI